MASVTNTSRTSFASGEVSPAIRAANDLARFQTGAQKVENLVVLIEAILTRRPGTRFILPAKTESQRGKMFVFRYSGGDYYVLAFNGGRMRVLKDGGFLESSPGTPYELTVPWVEADMANLRVAASGNIVLQVAGGTNKPRKLTRIAHTNWTIEEFLSKNGPVDPQNLDVAKTIIASATSGTGIALLGVGTAFAAGDVGSVMRLDESDLSIIPLWQPNEAVTVSITDAPAPSGHFGDMTGTDGLAGAFDGNLATAATKAGGTVGFVGASYAAPTSVYSARFTVVFDPAVFLRVSLYGKTGAAPASIVDGIKLGEIVLGGPSSPPDQVIYPPDPTTLWDHVWAVLEASSIATLFMSELELKVVADNGLTLRRYQTRVYEALSAGSAGQTPPIHTEGAVRAVKDGVVWRYRHRDRGYVRIATVTNATHATADVLERLPDSVGQRPTYRWWPPAWTADKGYPDLVALHEKRAVFWRDNTRWMTKPFTLDDFEEDPALPDSAITSRLLPPDDDNGYVDIQWAFSKGGALIQGARDNEWITRSPADNADLTILAIKDFPDNAEGSAPQIPAKVEKGAVFIGKSRDRLHYIKFAKLDQDLTVNEISVASRHILGAGAVALAWQRDPNRILWIMLADGTLASVTLMPDEKIVGFSRHPMANCFVEDIVAIPTNDNGRADIVLQTRRTINGATHRYYELLVPFFKPLDATAPTAAGAWNVDCGLRYQGASTSTITGLTHLIGQSVAVLADGAEQSRKVVDGAGHITLDYPAVDVIAGLPVRWVFQDLPRDVQVQGGTSKGEPKRASHIAIEVVNSAGGKVAFNASIPNDLTETGTNPNAAPIPLFTGQKRMTIASETQDEGVLELTGDNALPFTLAGVTPLLEIEDNA